MTSGSDVATAMHKVRKNTNSQHGK